MHLQRTTDRLSPATLTMRCGLLVTCMVWWGLWWGPVWACDRTVGWVGWWAVGGGLVVWFWCRLPRVEVARLPWLGVSLVAAMLGAMWSGWTLQRSVHLAQRWNIGWAPRVAVGWVAEEPITRRGWDWHWPMVLVWWSGQPLQGRVLVHAWGADQAPVHRGERWQLTLEAKPPKRRATVLRGVERYNLAHGWLGQANLRADRPLRWLNPPPTKTVEVHGVAVAMGAYPELKGPGGLRERLLRWWSVHADALGEVAWLKAWLLGDARALDWQVRRVFRLTGTSHLLAISGLHIGWVMVYSTWLVRALLGVPWACWLRWPVQGVTESVGLLMAWWFVGLSGWGVSAVRAGLGLTLWWVLALGRARWSAGVRWCCVGTSLLALSPSSGLSWSYVLSVSAVGGLACASTWLERRPTTPWWGKWCVMQGCVTLSTLPWVVWIVGGVSPWCWVANALAIPWTSWVVMPGLMLGLVLVGWWPAAATWVWCGVIKAATWQVWVLRAMSTWWA